MHYPVTHRIIPAQSKSPLFAFIQAWKRYFVSGCSCSLGKLAGRSFNISESASLSSRPGCWAVSRSILALQSRFCSARSLAGNRFLPLFFNKKPIISCCSRLAVSPSAASSVLDGLLAVLFSDEGFIQNDFKSKLADSGFKKTILPRPQFPNFSISNFPHPATHRISIAHIIAP